MNTVDKGRIWTLQGIFLAPQPRDRRILRWGLTPTNLPTNRTRTAQFFLLIFFPFLRRPTAYIVRPCMILLKNFSIHTKLSGSTDLYPSDALISLQGCGQKHEFSITHIFNVGTIPSISPFFNNSSWNSETCSNDPDPNKYLTQTEEQQSARHVIWIFYIQMELFMIYFCAQYAHYWSFITIVRFDRKLHAAPKLRARRCE